MLGRCLALVLLILAGAPCAQAADWVRSAVGTAGDSYDLDVSSISRQGDLVQSFMRQNLPRPQRDRNTGKAYVAAIVARYDDCAGRRYTFGEFIYRDRNDVTVATGKGSGGWNTVMPNSIGETLWRINCAVTSTLEDKPLLADLGAGNWQDLGPSADGAFELYIQRDEILRVDKDRVLVLSRSDYPTPQIIEGVPVRYILTANLIDCANLKWAPIGGDYYISPKLRVRSVRKKLSDIQLETINPGGFLFASVKAVCAPDAGRPLSAGADDEPGLSIGTAWGVEKGYLVTASHVIHGGEAILVYRNGERVGQAQVVADDPVNDLAVLKVSLLGHAKLNVLPLAARSPSLGRRVFTLGYPVPEMLGQHVKMTSGEVSSTTGQGDDARYLQISVPLQPGNSGGPVMGWDGAVVGVAEAVLKKFDEDGQEPAPQMVNYAVKVSYLRPLLEDLPARGNYVLVQARGEPEAVVAQVRQAVYMVVVATKGSGD